MPDSSMARKTDDPADTEVKKTPSIENEPPEQNTNCTTGHIRRKTYKGVCYCQMCCDGTWYYFYKEVGGKRVYMTCGTRPGWTVDCSGNNWILSC